MQKQKQTPEIGLTALQLLKLPKEIRAKVLTIKQHDHVLVETDIWKSCEGAYPAWTREFEAHVQPDKRFGSAIKYADPYSKQLWVFEVPTGPLRNAKNSILLANADDCEVEVKKNRIIVHAAEEKISVVENFPIVNSWYHTDPIFGIPVNPIIDPCAFMNGKYLHRTPNKVGFIIRGVTFGGGCRRDIDIGEFWPSDRFRVLMPADGATTSFSTFLQICCSLFEGDSSVSSVSLYSHKNKGDPNANEKK